MNHKDYLNHLKEKDPITFYEMKGNPTGVDSDTNGWGCLFLLFIGFGILLYVIL